ncbi:CNP1-like family protein [Sulfuriferula thiophila]|uniref:CNP1-like family protein n=1 Tax=Sulfuriferula thiophila TaxID=1781211 RepID=UPI000F60FC37|nr:CNP1-like family protein [Sulfuriferula thiophila]
MKIFLQSALIMCLGFSALSHAATGNLFEDNDSQINNAVEDGDKSWKEFQAHLPAFPKNENLVPFYVSGIAGNEYAIDKTTLDVGKDGVVRYALVITTRGGAKNVSFEGMRCETRERKIYALGRDDGTWMRARDAQWQGISGRSLLSYHRALADDYFCPVGLIVANPAEALRNIKAGW